MFDDCGGSWIPADSYGIGYVKIEDSDEEELDIPEGGEAGSDDEED